MLKLIGSELSPYTGKVRAYLRYKRIPFDPVQSSLEINEEILTPAVGWRVIPVIVTPEQKYVQDSTEIIHYLEKLHPQPSIYPQSPCQQIVSMLLELYADEWLVLPIMHYRWSFKENMPFIKQEFGNTAFPKESPASQRELAEMAMARFSNMLPVLGVNKETKPEIERGYQELLTWLSKHFEVYPFLLGYKPCIADFAFHGMLYAHLYRDPYPGYIMKQQAPLVCSWIEKMNQFTKDRMLYTHSVKDGKIVLDPLEASQEDFLTDDQIPETLFPILSTIFTEQAPEILDNCNILRVYLKEHHDVKKLPRNLGMHKFKVGNVISTRGSMTYPIWMLQSITDYYNSLPGKARNQIDAFLHKFKGAKEFVSVDLTDCRVERINNFLCAEQIKKSKL
ncbi:uncharacterized protein LOC117122331 [Anneissia japonica]|uniref:uncharacterized protein LOC117122331 n=1 Tax=Anneissia japonica TaxID=1529436 RepID=UPI001425510B|nr:uncharacterized protein LOC117122331 [Anneissia japonica]